MFVSLGSISLRSIASAALLLGSVSLGGLGSVSATPRAAFERWAGRHNKNYANETEHARRRAIWSDNVERIQRHNNAGGSPYHMTAGELRLRLVFSHPCSCTHEQSRVQQTARSPT